MGLYVFDIDGTLANIDHRLDYVRTKPKNWAAFDAGIPNDLVNEAVANIFYTLVNETDNDVLLASGRSDRTRDATADWIQQNILGNTFFDFAQNLYMRKDKDFRPDDVIKEEILDKIIDRFGKKPTAVFDDRPRVVAMWRKHGIWVFDCNQSGKDF